MVAVGDKVLVFAAGSEFATAVPLSTPLVGDKVALYNLTDGTRIAVPTLSFDLGDFAFVTPNFDFAGFDSKLDFNMQLIPLMIGLYGHFTDHDLRVGMNYSYYGDTPFIPGSGGCEKRLSDPRYGDVEYNFGDAYIDTPGEPHPDDAAVCLKFYDDGIEIWILSSRYYDYGGGLTKVYLFNTLIAEVDIVPHAQNHVFYHNEKWTKP